MTYFFGLHLILGGKLDVGRRFGLHMISRRKLDATLSVSRMRLRQPRSCWGSAALHGLRNTGLDRILTYETAGKCGGRCRREFFFDNACF